MSDGRCENYAARIDGMRREAASLETGVEAWHCGTGKGVPSCVKEKESLSHKAMQLRADADTLERLCNGGK